MIYFDLLPNERIRIGDDVTVTLVEILPGRKCRLGTDAPRSVRVDRLEVRERIERGDLWERGQR